MTPEQQKTAFEAAKAAEKAGTDPRSAAAAALGVGGADLLKSHFDNSKLTSEAQSARGKNQAGINMAPMTEQTEWGKMITKDTQDGKGALIKRDSEGAVSGEKEFAAFANRLENAGKIDQARAVRQYAQKELAANRVPAMSVAYSEDGKGNLLTASASAGGKAVFEDRGTHANGFNQSTDNSNVTDNQARNLSGYRGSHGYSNDVLDRDNTDRWSGKINGMEFNGASYSRIGASTTVTGTPVGGTSEMTTGSYLDPKTNKPIETFTTQKGGTKFSGDAAAKELFSGNLNTLQYAMKADKQAQRDYASKITEEAAKLADVSYMQSKGYSAKAGLSANGFGFSADYRKNQGVAVKQMNAQIQNIMASSGGSAEIAAPRIQALVNDHEKMALNDYKAMNMQDKSSKQHFTPEQSRAEAERQRAVWATPSSPTEAKILAHQQNARNKLPQSSPPPRPK